MALKYPSPKQAKKWPTLKPGDIIDIVAPASASSRQDLMKGIRYLKEMGFRPRMPKNIFQKNPKLFAQSDEVRFQLLKKALQAKDSKAIWCVRGGYGAIRLMPQLNKLKAPKHSKILIGYSDITTLHQFLNSKWKWPTIHGPLLGRFGRGENTKQETREVWGLFENKTAAVEHRGLKPVNAPARRKKTVRGSIVGGNISVLLSSLGTPFYVEPKGQIIFFEDLGERPHVLDRMLIQLTQAGYFRNAKAVVFGDLLAREPRHIRLIRGDVLPRFANALKIPVFTGVPAGHGLVQRPIPFLTEAELTTGKSATLKIKAARRR